jgi:hypothetical protein
MGDFRFNADLYIEGRLSVTNVSANTPQKPTELFPRPVPRDPKSQSCPADTDRIVSHAGIACMPHQSLRAAAEGTAMVALAVALPLVLAGAADVAASGLAAKAIGAGAESAGAYLQTFGREYGPKLCATWMSRARQVGDAESAATLAADQTTKAIDGFIRGVPIAAGIAAGKALLSEVKKHVQPPSPPEVNR